MTTVRPDDYKIDSLQRLLMFLNGGAFSESVNQALRDIVRAVDDHVEAHGGSPKAEMTIKIAIKASEDGVKGIAASLATKLPAVPPTKMHVWSRADGTLTLANPAQHALNFGHSVVTIDGVKS